MPNNFGLSKVNHILFDFDGTLVDTRKAVLRTFSKFAETLGVDAKEDVIGRFDGLTTYEIVETAKSEWNLPTTVAELTEQYIGLLAPTYAEVSECPGAFAMLTALAAQGRRLGIVTSAPKELVEPALKRLGWSGLFDCLICGMPGVPGKPNPALYLAALSTLGSRPENVVAVEDSVSGIRSAAAAGIRVIAVASPSTQTQLRNAGALFVMDDLESLLRVLP
jgi:glycerol 3-phosphatase-1